MSGALSINAAFLLEIKEDNDELRRVLADARQFFDHGRAAGSPQAAERLLGGLRDQLAVHFALEERFGYIETAVAAAPNLSSLAERIRGEHEQLFREACRLAETAQDSSFHGDAGGLSRLAEQFHGFFAALARHEEAERRLILQSHGEDIGVGD